MDQADCAVNADLTPAGDSAAGETTTVVSTVDWVTFLDGPQAGIDWGAAVHAWPVMEEDLPHTLPGDCRHAPILTTHDIAQYKGVFTVTDGALWRSRREVHYQRDYPAVQNGYSGYVWRKLAAALGGDKQPARQLEWSPFACTGSFTGMFTDSYGRIPGKKRPLFQ